MSTDLPAPNNVAVKPKADESCDRCRVPWKLQMILPSGRMLLFCEHHADEYADDLVRVGSSFVAQADFYWRGRQLLPAF